MAIQLSIVRSTYDAYLPARMLTTNVVRAIEIYGWCICETVESRDVENLSQLIRIPQGSQDLINYVEP